MYDNSSQFEYTLADKSDNRHYCHSSFLSLHLLGQPVLFIWIALCLTKTVLLKKWSIAALLIVSVLLPVVTATGSPTYTIFVLMVCSVVIPFQWSFPR